jgi:glycosyltransferase involved in cell wall biosynthesis
MTYPFVLSWSLLEAMSAGCVVIGSRSPPVEEAIDGKTNGYLVDFFDVDALADRICSVLRDPAAAAPLRTGARAHVIANYDLKSVCLPQHLELIGRLTGAPLAPRRRQRRNSAARLPLSAK